MRNDMKKVITECYRIGGRHSYRKVRRSNSRYTNHSDHNDDNRYQERSQGMRKPYRINGSAKSFGENLSPLVRYLTKQIGKRWDEVWSEICKELTTGKAIDDHVKEHIRWMVERNVIMVDGEPCYNKINNPKLRPGSLYVNPGTGVLKEVPAAIKKKTKTAYKTPLDEVLSKIKEHTHWFELKGGVIYRVHLDDISKSHVYNRAVKAHASFLFFLRLSPWEQIRFKSLLNTLDRCPFLSEISRLISVY